MKALSVRAPWWWWILHGGKPIENRTRQTHHRGPTLIHASTYWNKTDLAASHRAARAMAELAGYPLLSSATLERIIWPLERNRGHIVGLADIVECHPPGASMDPWHVQDQWGWKLENVKALDHPYPFKGALGLFDAPASDEVKNIIADRWHKEDISEGQGCKILGMKRLEFRKLCDERLK